MIIHRFIVCGLLLTGALPPPVVFAGPSPKAKKEKKRTRAEEEAASKAAAAEQERKDPTCPRGSERRGNDCVSTNPPNDGSGKD